MILDEEEGMEMMNGNRVWKSGKKDRVRVIDGMKGCKSVIRNKTSKSGYMKSFIDGWILHSLR